MNNKKIALFLGVFFGLFMGAYFAFTESVKAGLTLGIFDGLVFGVIMYFVFNSKRMKMYSQMEYGTDGELIISGGANHFFKGIAIGGRLILLKDKLDFKSHKFNIPSNEMQIQINDVDNVELYDVLGLFKTGLKIETNTGRIEKFVVNDRETWREKILATKAAS